MPSDVTERLKRVVSRQLKVPESKLTPEARFVEDLGSDSMRSIELIAAFEEEFGSELTGPDEPLDMDEAGKAQSIEDAIEFIKAELAK